MSTDRGRLILAVEDSDEDFHAFTRAMKQLNIAETVCRVCDGDDALDYLHHEGQYTDFDQYPRPSVILMDLNLPGTDGRDVIREIKQNEQLKTIPIVVLTTSSNPKDINVCYQYGINSYMLKPIGIEALKKTVDDFFHYWFKAVLLPGSQ
ncbi:response regulator [Almyronema epifaneia]|uniref:Response regulator n=1 Tax=Almyronema epifaneia S1 TaxID=2991925 RepID=A0ABW6I9X8_9CYAN